MDSISGTCIATQLSECWSDIVGTVINNCMYAHSMWKYASLKVISALLLSNISHQDYAPGKIPLSKILHNCLLSLTRMFGIKKNGVNFKETHFSIFFVNIWIKHEKVPTFSLSPFIQRVSLSTVLLCVREESHPSLQPPE